MVLIIINILGLFINLDDSAKGRLLFNSTQSLIMLILTFIPPLIESKKNLLIPDYMEIIFIFFCFFHFILGEINHFYLKFWWWDSALHFLSGFLIAILGYSIINAFNKSYYFHKQMPIEFIIFFMICLSLSFGTLWEIFEFICDEFLLTNMQRYQNVNTQINFIGHNALNDTMKDLMLDFLGSLIMSLITYYLLKKNMSSKTRHTNEG